MFMDTPRSLFAMASFVVGISCFVPYIRDIFLHKTTPHIYSWLIWAILQVTGAVAMFNSGAGWGITPLVLGATLCASVFILSFKYGTKNITRLDLVCLISALAIFCFYLFTRQALLSVILVSVIDIIGSLPTFRKAYAEPFTETASTYVLSAIADGFALGALANFGLTTSLYLFTLIIVDGICSVLIIVRRS
jgi:hypothetical protein